MGSRTQTVALPERGGGRGLLPYFSYRGMCGAMAGMVFLCHFGLK